MRYQRIENALKTHRKCVKTRRIRVFNASKTRLATRFSAVKVGFFLKHGLPHKKIENHTKKVA
jgi:hypothetical protein